MGLETATYLSGLNSSNPVGGTDPVSQGDDHIRLLKTTLKNSFPNVNKPVYFPNSIAAKTADYTVIFPTDGGKIIPVDATDGGKTVTLPDMTGATGEDGFYVIIWKSDAGANTVTVDGHSGDEIDGAETFVLANQYDKVHLVWSGTQSRWLAFPGQLNEATYNNLLAIEALAGTDGVPVKTADGSWELDQLVTTLTFIKDMGNAELELEAGVLGEVQIDFNCTIVGVTLLADQAGDVVVDIWKDTFANYPPTVADSICASAKPTIVAGLTYEDTTLTGWTVALSAGDVLRFNIDSVDIMSRIAIKLKVRRYG